jgi:hypothetical protein
MCRSEPWEWSAAEWPRRTEPEPPTGGEAYTVLLDAVKPAAKRRARTHGGPLRCFFYCIFPVKYWFYFLILCCLCFYLFCKLYFNFPIMCFIFFYYSYWVYTIIHSYSTDRSLYILFMIFSDRITIYVNIFFSYLWISLLK